MAKYRPRFKRPRFLQSASTAKTTLKHVGEALVSNTLNTGMKAIQQAQPKDIHARRMPKYLQVTQDRMDRMGVIDLKPFFEKSGKKKMGKNGWYLVIPIRRKKKDMSRRMYEQLRQVEMEPGTSKTVISDYLYDRRRQSDATMLNYEPQSNNITKQTNDNGRSTYVSYRTVSAKSPASSWIINRSRVNEKDTSKTFIKNVDKVMKWKMKNM